MIFFGIDFLFKIMCNCMIKRKHVFTIFRKVNMIVLQTYQFVYSSRSFNEKQIRNLVVCGKRIVV